jgi:hypothetical protein
MLVGAASAGCIEFHSGTWWGKDTDGECCTDASRCYVKEGALPTDHALVDWGTWACAADPIQADWQVDARSFEEGGTSQDGYDYSSTSFLGDALATGLEEATAAWSPSSGAPNVVWGTPVVSTSGSSIPQEQDGRNEFFMEDTGQASDHDAVMWTDCQTDTGETGDASCQFVDCDVFTYAAAMNDAGGTVAIAWSTSIVPDAGYYSLPKVWAHELGHVLGIDHASEALFPDSIMLEVGDDEGEPLTSPSSDDLAAAVWIYGSK